MMIVTFNLLEILSKALGNSPKKKPVESKTGKFTSEIEMLRSKFSLTKGSRSEIELQDLLKLCPRKRKRVDAYKGLVSELKRNEITLIINSQKKRRIEDGTRL